VFTLADFKQESPAVNMKKTSKQATVRPLARNTIVPRDDSKLLGDSRRTPKQVLNHPWSQTTDYTASARNHTMRILTTSCWSVIGEDRWMVPIRMVVAHSFSLFHAGTGASTGIISVALEFPRTTWNFWIPIYVRIARKVSRKFAKGLAKVPELTCRATRY
jgi:hypothetical protein